MCGRAWPPALLGSGSAGVSLPLAGGEGGAGGLGVADGLGLSCRIANRQEMHLLMVAAVISFLACLVLA